MPCSESVSGTEGSLKFHVGLKQLQVGLGLGLGPGRAGDVAAKSLRVAGVAANAVTSHPLRTFAWSGVGAVPPGPGSSSSA